MNSLELQFINGEGDLALPHVKEVRWDEESELNIELILEDVRKRPAKIQNEAHSEIYKEKINKIRELEREIKREFNKKREPLKALSDMINGSVKPALQDLAKESTAILNEITHWESMRRIGLSATRQKAEEQIAVEEQKLATLKSPKEKSAAKKRIETLKVEGGLVTSKESKPSHGVALVKRWKGKLANPVLYFKSKYAEDGYFECVADQHKINEFCKEIIRNGGKITGATMPGVELTEEEYAQWRG